MSLANILIYIALIVYVLYGKAKGWPMKPPKRLFLLPVIIVVIGYGDVTHGTMKPVEVALTVVGAAVSLGLGLLRGRADKISIRNGAQFVQWGRLSFALFATNLVVKLIFDGVGVAAGSTFSAAEKSLVFTLGLTLLGEAIALLVRSGATNGLLNSAGAGATRPRRTPTDNFTSSNAPFRTDGHRTDGHRTDGHRTDGYRTGDRSFVTPPPAPPAPSSYRADRSAQPAPFGDATAPDGTRQWRPSLRDGVVNWINQRVDPPTTTDSNNAPPAAGPTDDSRSRRHEHDDHHHNHHGLTGPR